MKIEHKDGVDWFGCPAPPKSHKCWIQTTGYRDDWGIIPEVHRCACGALAFAEAPGRELYWMERNTRSKSAPEPVVAKAAKPEPNPYLRMAYFEMAVIVFICIACLVATILTGFNLFDAIVINGAGLFVILFMAATK